MQQRFFSNPSATPQTVVPGEYQSVVSHGVLHDTIELVESLNTQLTSQYAENCQLRDEILRLRGENARLSYKVSDLKTSNERLWADSQRNPSFFMFSKLPAEMRLMVWRYAFEAPQTLVFRDGCFSQSRINIIMQVNTEARYFAREFNLPWFPSGPFADDQGSEGSDSSESDYEPRKAETRQHIKNHFNPKSTTIWMADKTLYVFSSDRQFKEDLPVHCDLCDAAGRSIRRPCEHSQPLECLAFSFWNNPQEREERRGNLDGPGPHSMGTARGIWRYGAVQELLLVVNETANHDYREVSFVTPVGDPSHGQLGETVTYPPGAPRLDKNGTPWEVAARETRRRLEWFMLRRARHRAILMQNAENTYQVLERRNLHAFDVSDWVIPRVRYVEAISGKGKWVKLMTASRNKLKKSEVVNEFKDEEGIAYQQRCRKQITEGGYRT